MKNNLPHAVKVFTFNNDIEKLCGVVGPDEKFNVPLSAVYTENGKFVLEPIHLGLVHLPIKNSPRQPTSISV